MVSNITPLPQGAPTKLTDLVSGAQKVQGVQPTPQPTTPVQSNSTPSPLNLPQSVSLKDILSHAGAFTGDVNTLPKEMSVGDASKMMPLLQSNHHSGYTGYFTTSTHVSDQGNLPSGYDPKTNYGNFLGGQCTSYAAWYWSNVLGKQFVDKGGNGNAKNWPQLAKEQGYSVSTTPQPGDIVSWPDMGQYGHVAICQSVNPDGTINVSEMNYVPNKYTTRNNVSTRDAQFIH